jgi:hypothetical protein
VQSCRNENRLLAVWRARCGQNIFVWISAVVTGAKTDHGPKSTTLVTPLEGLAHDTTDGLVFDSDSDQGDSAEFVSDDKLHCGIERINVDSNVREGDIGDESIVGLHGA